MPSSRLILCHPLLLLPPIPPSIRVFSNESILRMRWPKYWTFSFSIIPSKEIPGLISFRMDWLDLLAVQGTLKSLLQHHSSKASILWHSAFFTVQPSHQYMTTGKTIALTRQTFVGKVMSLLFNMLSRLVITRCSKCIFNLYFQLMMVLLGCNPIISWGRSVWGFRRRRWMREAKGWEEDEKHCWVTGDREFWDVTWCYWEGCWHWLTLMFFPKYYRMSCDIIIRSMSCCCCCYITLVVSNSVRPHRRQPTRIPRPWDCPGKNTGAGCHFLLQCRKVKSESEVT